MTASPYPPPAPTDDQAATVDVVALQREYQRLSAQHEALCSCDIPDLKAIDQVQREMDLLQSRLRALTLRPDDAGFRERPPGI